MKDLNLHKLGTTGQVEKSTITLYHGSKGGIIGRLGPKSRERCDFGCGFYMGTLQRQAFSICLNSNSPHFYKCTIDLSGLRILHLEGMEWAVLVGLQRNRLDYLKDTRRAQSMLGIVNSVDVIEGPIADDSIYTVFQSFLDASLTDEGLIAALTKLGLGTQYTLKTQRACDRLDLVELFPTPDEFAELERFGVERSELAQAVFQEIMHNYRRTGRDLIDYRESGWFDYSMDIDRCVRLG